MYDEPCSIFLYSVCFCYEFRILDFEFGILDFEFGISSCTMYLSVYITTANSEEAERIARTVVEERLAACVNFFPCRSIYRWKGKIEEDSEYVLICKTKKRLFQQLRKRLREIHSYDVPAIVAYDIVDGEGEFLQWVSDSTMEA